MSGATVPTTTREFITIDDPRWTQCHASTVAVTDETVVTAWFAGTHEGTPDNRIYLSSAPLNGSADQHRQWSAATPLDTGIELPHWNPVLSMGPDGALWLFFKTGALISEWVTHVTRSHDQGRNWEPVHVLVAGDSSGGRGPVKNPPLLTPAGTWLAPGSRERWAGKAQWDPFVDVSRDAGTSWQQTDIPVDHTVLDGAGHIQPVLWKTGETTVALMRSTEGRAYRSVSADDGRTWSAATPTQLANNNSGLTAAALPSGRIACVHNPSTESWGSRCPLVLSTSDDNGLTWATGLTLDDGKTPVRDGVSFLLGENARPGFVPGDAGVITTGVNEYSYPSVLVSADSLLVTYTWQRRGIVLATVPLTLVESNSST